MRISLRARNARFAAATASLAAFIAVAGFGGRAMQLRGIVDRADAMLDANQTAAAVQALEPVRDSLTSSLRSCSVLVHAYFAARDADRLEWSAQSCLRAGIDACEVHIGAAAALELRGRDDEALKQLDLIARRFDRLPDAHYRMSRIYRRKQALSQAGESLLQAAKRTSDPTIAWEALDLLLQQSQNALALEAANLLKDSPTGDAEQKLKLARALLRGGDQGRAQFAVIEAKRLMATLPVDRQSEIALVYADVLPSRPSDPIARAPGSD